MSSRGYLIGQGPSSGLYSPGPVPPKSEDLPTYVNDELLIVGGIVNGILEGGAFPPQAKLPKRWREGSMVYFIQALDDEYVGGDLNGQKIITSAGVWLYRKGRWWKIIDDPSEIAGSITVYKLTTDGNVPDTPNTGPDLPPSGWSELPPTKPDKGYYIWASVLVQKQEDESYVWSTPTIWSAGVEDGGQGQPGAPGVDGRLFDTWFLESASQPLPPSNTFPPTGGWTQTTPSNPTLPVWSSFILVDEAGSNPEYPWSFPVKVTGIDGISTEVWYKESVVIPSKPVSYPPDNTWSKSTPDNPSNPVWSTTIEVRDGEAVGSDWTLPQRVTGIDGTNGTNGTDGLDGREFRYFYLESATKPNTPPSGTFPPVGWSTDNADNPTNPIWRVWIVVNRDGSNPQYPYSTVLKVSGTDGVDGTDGSDGENGIATELWYKESSVIPSRPTEYPPAGWSLATPETPTYPVWSTTVPVRDGSSVGDFTFPQRVTGIDGQDGADGADGTNGQDGADGQDGMVIRLFYRTDTLQPTKPTGTTLPPTGWSAEPPARTVGQYVWVSTTYAANTEILVGNGVWTSPAQWTGDSGSDGENGADGQDGQTIYTEFQYGPTTDTTTGWTSWGSGMRNGDIYWRSRTVTGGIGGTPSAVSRIKGEDGQDGQDGQDGANGSTGATGVRGPVRITVGGRTSWSDSVAWDTVSSHVVGLNPSTPAAWDVVTQTNNLNFIETRRYVSGSNPGIWQTVEFIVDGDVIIDGTVRTSKIDANAITTDKINALAVTADKINANAVTAEKIDANAVTAEKIDAGAITTDKLGAESVTAGKITAGAITTDKIAALNVTAEKISTNAITSDKIAAGAIETEKLNANAVTADKIAANAITTAKLDAQAVTADKIAAGTITGNQINAGTQIRIGGSNGTQEAVILDAANNTSRIWVGDLADPGGAKFRVEPDGSMHCQDATIRGTLYAGDLVGGVGARTVGGYRSNQNNWYFGNAGDWALSEMCTITIPRENKDRQLVVSIHHSQFTSGAANAVSMGIRQGSTVSNSNFLRLSVYQVNAPEYSITYPGEPIGLDHLSYNSGNQQNIFTPIAPTVGNVNIPASTQGGNLTIPIQGYMTAPITASGFPQNVLGATVVISVSVTYTDSSNNIGISVS